MKSIFPFIIMKRTFFWALISFLTVIHHDVLYCQNDVHGTVEGKVTNASDGSSLVGVTVLIEGTVLGTASDVNGFFRLTNVPEGKRVLQFSIIGFEREKRSLNVRRGDKQTVNVSLKEKAFESEEVVVTASRRPQSLEEVPVSIGILDGKEIERRTITSLDQALRYIPGVNMTESQVNVRGSSGYSRAFGTRVLLLVDGIPLLTGDSKEIKFDAIPMFAIDRIEVVKGAGSALYGSSALGGVINVITKTPREDFWAARLYASVYDNPYYPEWKWWSNGMRVVNGFDLQRAGVSKNYSYLVGGGMRNNRGYRLLDDNLRWNASGKVWFELTPLQSLTTSASYSSDDHGNWIFWRDLKNALVPPASTDLSERVISTKFQATSQYRNTLDDDLALTVKTQYYRTENDLTSDTADFTKRPLDRIQSVAHLVSLEAQASYLLTPVHFLTFGVEGNYSLVDAITYGNRHGGTIAFYAQDDFTIMEGVNASLGLRGDVTKIDTSASEGKVNPRIGVAYALSRATTLRASAGTGFRAPTIGEKFAVASSSGITTKPNPGLRSEKSISMEIGAKHDVEGYASIDAAVFQSNYEDLVEPVVDVKDGKIVFQNVNKARIRGFEIGVQSGWLDKLLQVNLGYTYIYPEDLTLNRILKYRPRHLFYATGIASYADFDLQADFRYISRMEEIDDELSVVVRDTDKRVETFVTDLRLSYSLASLSLPLRATFAVNNLFNYNYVEIIANLAPIRNYTLTLEMKM